MVVWPTIGATGLGRGVGRAASVRLGLGRVLTVGKLLAVASIPVALAVYFWQLVPPFARRYRLTNRRVLIDKGLTRTELASIRLEEFDQIDVEILAGQEYLHCGELIFRRGGQEVFRLFGVPRPQVFREVCLKARNAVVAVSETLSQQAGRPAK